MNRMYGWARQKVHLSWFIAWVSIGLLVGVLLAPIVGHNFSDKSWLLIAASLFVISISKRARYFLIVACAGGLLIGLWRGGSEQVNLHKYQPYYKSQVTVVGRVTEDTSFGRKGDQRMRVGDVRIKDTSLPGTLWISLDSKADIKRGDKVTISGVLLEGFGNIPGSMFKANIVEVTRPQPGDIGRRARDWFGAGVEKAVPGENAQFALAYLVGQKLTISDKLNDQLKTIGLIHAVVASGAHLTILIGAVRRLFVKVSKYLTALFSVGMISGFILITGFSPSMTRAGLVTLLSLAAWYYGRVIHPFVLLPFAAALTVLYSPAYMWGDIGWYLSFAAFTGVIVLTPLLHHYFWGKSNKPGFVRDVLVATIAAQITTLPIAIYAFEYFSVYAVLANVLVVPLIPITMLITFVSGTLGLIFPSVATWFGLPLQWILEYMKWIVNLLANLPGARNEVSINLYTVALGYAAIALITGYLLQVTKHNFRRDTELQHEF